jgi:glycine cleavage system regulatory protein
MISNLVSVSAIGVNRVGTLSRYFNNIYKNNGSIQKSTLKNFNNIFVLNADIQFPKDQNLNFLYPDLYKLSDSTRVTPPFYAIVNPEKNIMHNKELINIKTEISDTCGIISNQVSSLEKYNCTIQNFNSTCEPAPHSSTPLFSLQLQASFDKKNDINNLIDEIRHNNARSLCEISVGDKIITDYDGMGF